MNPQLRTVLIMIAPLIAVAGFGVGMRAGASRLMPLAEISVAKVPEHATVAYLVVNTLMRQDRFDERTPLSGLTLTAKSLKGTTVTSFATNADSIAVIPIPLDNQLDNSLIEVSLSSNELDMPLAEGIVQLSGDPLFFKGETTLNAIEPARAEGQPVKLFAIGGSLPVAFENDLVVRIAGHGAGELILDPEPGLLVTVADQQPCLMRDLTFLRAQPNFAVTGLAIKDGRRVPSEGTAAAAQSTEWFGPLPTSPGLASVDLPIARFIGADQSFEVELSVPSPKRAFYFEIDNAEGQWFQTVLTAIDQKTRVTIPPLPPGDYVAVLANHFSARDKANARLQPFSVGQKDVCARAEAALRIPSELALQRKTVLSGATAVELAVVKRRKRGFGIGFASLMSGLIALGLLVYDAARDTQRKLRKLAADAELQDVEATVSDKSGAVLALVLAFLGFSTLALVALTRMF